MKRPEDCSVEELLCSIKHWEGPEHMCLARTEAGEVILADFEWTFWVQKPTMKEALIAFGYHSKNRFKRYGDEPSGGINWSMPQDYSCKCESMNHGRRTCVPGNFEGKKESH